MSNGSGDYVIAFSTSREARRRQDQAVQSLQLLPNDAMDDLFQGVAEATEEAILNSMFRAEGTRGHRGAVPALPLEIVLPLVRDAAVAR